MRDIELGAPVARSFCEGRSRLGRESHLAGTMISDRQKGLQPAGQWLTSHVVGFRGESCTCTCPRKRLDLAYREMKGNGMGKGINRQEEKKERKLAKGLGKREDNEILS